MLSAIGCALTLFATAAEKVTLVQEGVAKCRVEIRADATPPERLAKEELEKYFAVATGCGELKGAYPIVLGIVPGEEDSFTIEVTPEKMTITDGNEEGLLYGTFEVLKRYAGMRWLFPGEDGEYCVPVGKTIAVPVGGEFQKPHLKVRRTVDAYGALAQWHIRNGMQNSQSVRGITNTQKNQAFSERWCVRGYSFCGHCLASMILGDIPTGMKAKDWGEQLLKEHPEWHGLIAGKRRACYDDARSPNPCVSNPATLDRLAESFIKICSKPHADEAIQILGNNDSGPWCQCPNCRALDAPELKNTRGELSDRYWYMVNGIAQRVWKTCPKAKIGGWCYQNFWFAPTRVKPDPRLYVNVSFNNQCWRHSCLDPACTINKTMVKIYAGWKKLGMIAYNRDEIGGWDSYGSPGCEFEPAETVVLKNFREYDAIGCKGSSFCVNTPTSTWAWPHRPFYGTNYNWYAMWQTCYVGAKGMWDPSKDYTADLEEANRLYYGAAWEGGMREFRALLTKCFLETPGCIGWGQGATIARCLDHPGSAETLTALLDRAIASAKAAGDARALKHVERERNIFNMTWLTQRREYLANYRELTAYRRTGAITVDGVLDEKDWVQTDSYENFAPPSWMKDKMKSFQKTYLKMLYDGDTLYFGVTAMEPTPEKIVAGEKVNRAADGLANIGDRIELWYAYPDMNEASWHMMFNSKGQIIDARMNSVTDRDTSVVTRGKWAVKVSPDRWTLEFAVPCSEIGQKIMDGMTWRVNCARERLLSDGTKESSTAANGNYHGTARFVNVRFVPAHGSSTRKARPPSWQNATLNAVVPAANKEGKKRWGKWKGDTLPQGDWYLEADGEMKSHPGDPDNKYVSFSKGEISQWYLPFAAGNNRLTLKARGKGTLSMIIISYEDPDKARAGGYKQLTKAFQPNFKLTPEWKTYTAEFKTLGRPTERVSVRFCAGRDSQVDMDDLFVAPCE